MGDHRNEERGEGRRDGHLTVYLAWPLLAGLGLATVLSVSVGGVVLIASRGDWQLAGKVLGTIWFAVLGAATMIVFVYAAREWAGPRRAERIERTRQEVVEVVRDEVEPPAPIIIRGFPSPPLLPATVDHTIESLAPAADPEIDHLYRFVLDAWQHDDVTQAGCMSRGWRRKDWDKFVGGSRRRSDVGKESARGLLDRAGIIRKDGSGWTICATLEQALSINDDLNRYANARAQLVRLDKSDQTSQDRAAGVSGVSGERG